MSGSSRDVGGTQPSVSVWSNIHMGRTPILYIYICLVPEWEARCALGWSAAPLAL